ncbi:hypothetical protein CTAYLR_003887 [Chrysophaeum taylorii]|uniref:Ammonium transporter n=1 Tax=Chrysophaeum taylorii TaxID=2483200 RepID=A0AAD7UM29_9STRA|nr:hypothetical protein CTAYLR_003887 [Chrysophaeum taylorii]
MRVEMLAILGAAAFLVPMCSAADDDLEARIAALESTVAGMADTVDSKLDAVDADTFWLLFGTVLVFFMQAGFAMLEVGQVAVKNTKNILIKNIFDAVIAALFWWATGYGLAFGADGFVRRNKGSGENGFYGGSGFFYEGIGSGDDASPLTNTPSAKTYGKASWMFQWAFAGTTATIVSGAIAERATFGAYVAYSCLLVGYIYPAVVHMGWSSDGKFSPWREKRLFGGCGMIDFAGSGVVHMTGGVSAVIASTFVGPRKGRFGPDAKHLEQQSVVFQSLGTLILWVGWYGFNGASTLAIQGYGGVAAHVFMTTTIAAATSCISCVLVSYLLTHIIDPSMANNGILAGLVAITAGCSTSNNWGAFFTGLVACPVYMCASKLLVKLEIDDVVDAFPVHGACGCWGVIAAALFASEFYYANAYYSDRKDDCAGIFYGGDGGSLGAAVCFIFADIGWTGANIFLLFLVCKYVYPYGIRVDESVEDVGMDDSKHGGHCDVPMPPPGATNDHVELQTKDYEKEMEA